MRFLLTLALGLLSVSNAFSDQPPKRWVLMIPGAGSSGDRIWVENLPSFFGGRYFGVFQDTLSDQGIESEVCPKTADEDSRTVEERAEECVQVILWKQSELGGSCQPGAARNVVVLGHSMGGLVARLLAQDPRVSSCIQSVTTVSTPHRGSAIADLAIEHAYEDGDWDLIGKVVRWIGFYPEHVRYLPELRTDRSQTAPQVFHAQDIQDNPAVQYFSISTSVTHTWIVPLELGRAVIERLVKDRHQNNTPYGTRNDGVVPEYSMIHGKYLGHLEVAHWESACVDPIRLSPGCSDARDKIIPFLKTQVEE